MHTRIQYCERKKKRIIIPIGSTGDAAATIYQEVKTAHDYDYSNYAYLHNYFEALKNETDINKIVEIVIKIVKSQSSAITVP